MKYKLVIFDFDGTLADSFPAALRLAERLSEMHGLARIDQTRLEKLRGMNIRETIKAFNISPWKLPWLMRDARRIMSEAAGEIKLFEGLGALLPRIAEKGIKIAIVTSNSKKNVLQILGGENAALVDYYECDAGLFGKKANLTG